MYIYIVLVIISYLLGNISCGYLVGRFIFNEDIRTHGSKNAGTTNALRLYGAKAGAITLLGDLLKGFIAVIISYFVAKNLGVDHNLARYLSLVAVVFGHNWPVFLRFRGGKGVATTYGGVLAISPLVTIFAAIFLAICIISTNYMSVGSMLSISLMPILFFIRGDITGVWFGIVLAMSCIYKHKSNILRLLSGTENKLKVGGMRNE